MVKQAEINPTEITLEQKKNFRDWWEKNKNEIHSPKKYYKAQKSVIIENTKSIFSKTPDIPIKKVIIEIMTSLPDFLPAANLIKVVGYIVKTWEKEMIRSATKST